MRLIDRDILAQELWSVMCDIMDEDDTYTSAKMMSGLIKAKEKLEDVPTINPARCGKWIIRDNPGTGWYKVTCSECGEDVTSTIPMIGFFPNAKPLWDYCPWCGVRMGGDEDEL